MEIGDAKSGSGGEGGEDGRASLLREEDVQWGWSMARQPVAPQVRPLTIITLHPWKSPLGQSPLALHLPLLKSTQNLCPAFVFSANFPVAWMLADGLPEAELVAPPRPAPRPPDCFWRFEGCLPPPTNRSSSVALMREDDGRLIDEEKERDRMIDERRKKENRGKQASAS